MQEYHITIAGDRKDLPQPFHVLATQNPLEQEGTYPLPEAQLDRFLMQVDVGYPELAAERQILLETTGLAETEARPVIDAGRLQQVQGLIRQMPVGEKVVDAILALVRSARPGNGNADTDKNVAWGPGPRAGQALMLCARARALYDGRLAPSITTSLRSPSRFSSTAGADLRRPRRGHVGARRHRRPGEAGQGLTHGLDRAHCRAYPVR